MIRVAAQDTDNPLLAPPGLPAFDRIRPEHVVPAIESLVAQVEARLDELERNAGPSWESTIAAIEELFDPLERAWLTVRHLAGVQSSDAMRAAHERVQPGVVRLNTRIAQSRALFDQLEALRAGPDWERLDAARRRIVECHLRDARLSGVELDGTEREQFSKCELELAQLGTRFANHVLDSTKAFAVVVRDPREVVGIPAGARASAAAAARAAGEEGASAERGPWRFSLDGPSYTAVMRHAADRGLRERMYRAFVTRASEGEWDNASLIARTLALRTAQARRLGYASHAQVSIARKMAPGVDEVFALLEELRAAALPAARREIAELVELARLRGAPEALDFQPWDQTYWEERLREERYGIEEEALRAYFPLPAVLAGLFALTEQLFGVRVRGADGEAPVWHPDVRFFRVEGPRTASGRREELAAFYLDAFSRPHEKRGGAWQGNCIGRARVVRGGVAELRLPVAYVCCNSAPPTEGRPALLTFSEVRTLFHEFGHALQHMLTTVDEGKAAGLRNVEWDAVEIASQFMENWLYHRETLLALARHWETGAQLPEETFERLRDARTHMAGSSVLRQVRLALTDLHLHHGFDGKDAEEAFALARRVDEGTTVVASIPEDRWLCAFSHIFAGAYSAGYYSYKWAEVLSADAFAAFEEAGLEDRDAVRAIGRRFRETFLALGGSRAPMEVFTAFRGRGPRPEALLRHSGLAG